MEETDHPETRPDIAPLLAALAFEELFSPRERREAAFALADGMAAEPTLETLDGHPRSDYLLTGAYEAIMEALEVPAAPPDGPGKRRLLELAIDLCPLPEARTARALDLLAMIERPAPGHLLGRFDQEILAFLAQRYRQFEGEGAVRIGIALTLYGPQGIWSDDTAEWTVWFRRTIGASLDELACLASSVHEWIADEPRYRARLAANDEMADRWDEGLADCIAAYESAVDLTAEFIEELCRLCPEDIGAQYYSTDLWLEAVMNDAVSPHAVRRAAKTGYALCETGRRPEYGSRTRGEWLAEMYPFAEDDAEARQLARQIAEFCNEKDVEINGLPASWWWGMAGEAPQGASGEDA